MLRFAFSVEWFPLTLTLSLREREQVSAPKVFGGFGGETQSHKMFQD